MNGENEHLDFSQASASGPRETRVSIFLVVVLATIMLAGVHHSYLWAPDEPREAEIAREALVDGHWVTPHLCGLPFLEKPPLFYDIVAAAYALTGSISPSVARSVSAVFGIFMLAGVFFFCRRWAGQRGAWLSVLVLVSMPRFYHYSHLILLDIAVGAFCTVALVAFAFWLWWADSNAKKQAQLCLFYLASAGAAMTKGVVGVFHVVVIVGVFCLISRRWQTLRKLIFAWPILLFIIPVAAWIYLLYREGGIAYLHEHFVNNVAGRFLHMHFVLPGVNFHHTDVGKISSWYFYIKTLPSILGAAVVILPLVIWKSAAKITASLRNRTQNQDMRNDVRLFLLIWAVLPLSLLSFSAAKEVSYIIPSYAAMAILIGAWVDGRMPKTEDKQWRGIGWLAIAAVVAVLSIFLSHIDARTYVDITVGFVALMIPVLLILPFKRLVTQSCFLVIAVAICPPIICFSPNVRYDFHKFRCALHLAGAVWEKAGSAPVYLYQPSDMIRGSISFYANRTVRELDVPKELRTILVSGQRVFVLSSDVSLKSIQADTSFTNLYEILPLPDFALKNQFVLLTNGGNQ